MRFERIVFSLIIVALAVVAAVNWRRAALFSADNQQLRVQHQELEDELQGAARQTDKVKEALEKNRAQTSELMKLRSEVTQLRSSEATARALAIENKRLQSENQQLRANSASATPAVRNRGQFPRESWSFAGYGTPESALVSAIWAMKEGDPRTYLESLSPQEQERMAQTWQGKAEQEIARKHQSDVSAIAGVQVLERQNISADEVVMNVYLEGPGRMEKIRMKQVGADWKFGGFIREPAQ